jgi:hypothetical protein
VAVRFKCLIRLVSRHGIPKCHARQVTSSPNLRRSDVTRPIACSRERAIEAPSTGHSGSSTSKSGGRSTDSTTSIYSSRSTAEADLLGARDSDVAPRTGEPVFVLLWVSCRRGRGSDRGRGLSQHGPGRVLSPVRLSLSDCGPVCVLHGLARRLHSLTRKRWSGGRGSNSRSPGPKPEAKAYRCVSRRCVLREAV